MKSLQRQVADFTKSHRLNAQPQMRLLDLTSETGELCKEWLKTTQYGKQPFALDNQHNWQQEMGDVLFSLICLANDTNIDLQQALQQALDKYARRIAQHGSAASQSSKSC